VIQQWTHLPTKGECGEDPDVGLLDDEVRDELVGMLPDLVITLRQYWFERVPPGSLVPGGIGAPVTGPQPVTRESEPGRNDPCPCGSGKKYKKCCGSPAVDDPGGKTRH
jgi:hypothetical protein